MAVLPKEALSVSIHENEGGGGGKFPSQMNSTGEIHTQF